MPAFSAASGSFHAKSSFTNFVTVFMTVRLLPFFLTVVSICSCTLMVSTFRARSYTDQRYWSMHSSLRTHSPEASSGLTFTSGSAGGTVMAGSATAAAQSRTAKLPHTKQPNPLKSVMFAPVSPCPGSFAPLCLGTRTATRVTPLFRLSVQGAHFYHPAFPLNHRGEWLPTICRFGDGLVQMQLGGGSG